MWSAFVTGMANQATEMIQKRDKDIQDTIETQLAQMYKRAVTSRGERKERLTELRELRNALESAGFKGQEVTFLLQNKSAAANAIKLIETRKAKGREVTRAHLDSLLAGEMPKISKMGMPEEFITQQTTLEEEPSILDVEMKGAFGLGAGSARQAAEARIGSQTGMTADELRKTRLPKAAMQPVSLNYKMFAEPESTEDIKTSLRDIIARTERTDEGKLDFTNNKEDVKQYDTLVKQLEASVLIDDMFDAEKEKPRTAPAIRAIIKGRLAQALDHYVHEGVAMFTQSGDVVPITGDTKDIARFRQTKLKIVKGIAANRNLYDPRTMEVIGGRETEDALSDFATIENGKIVSWDTEAPDASSNNLTASEIQRIRNDAKEKIAQYTEENKLDKVKAVKDAFKKQTGQNY